MRHFDDDFEYDDLDDDEFAAALDGELDDDNQTAGEFAQQLIKCSHEVIAVRESMVAHLSLEERRAHQELLLGKDFIAQLRRADDWAFEAMMRMGDVDVDGEGHLSEIPRATFCLQAAMMTNNCHGTLWPHLKFQTQSHDQCMEMVCGLAAMDEAASEHMVAANRALGIDDPCDAVAPRTTGSLDLDALEQVAMAGGSTASGIKSSLLEGGLPALVSIEQRNEREAVVIHARCLRRDAEDALLLEMLFMHNTRETFHAKGSLELLTFKALRQEVGDIRKVICTPVELKELLGELKANSAKVSVACHMRRREGFALGKEGEQAVSERVVREPLEVSFLRVSAPRSAALVGALAAKAKGNAKFSSGLLAEALELYQSALGGFQECAESGVTQVREEVGKVHANRAECYLRQERWPEAVAEAGAALAVDGNNVKALFRRAKALEAQGEVTAAVSDLRAVVRVDPKNQQARASLVRLRADADAKTPPRCPKKGPSADAKTPSPVPQHRRQDTATLDAAMGHQRDPDVDSGALPAPSAWASGLSPAMQHEWLVDCYRLRVDDEYAWGGGELRGLYAQATGGGGSVAFDFLLFCKLAARHGVVPTGWDWAAFLGTARGLLRYAFEKSDAKEKYGQENVFAVAMGGRSLRYTGEVVYGSSVTAMGQSEAEQKMEARVGGGRFHDDFFEDIGGATVWREAGLVPEPRSDKGKGKGKSRGSGRGKGTRSEGRGRSACRHYQSGHCSYGEHCHFAHEGPQGAVAGTSNAVPLCRFWQSGRCVYGESCRYRHGSLAAN